MLKILTLFLVATFIAGCSSNQNSTDSAKNPFTQGNVTLRIKKGKTTQEEVLNVFGAPNIVTKDAEGLEVWTYQKFATVSQGTQSDGYATIILAGGSSSSTRFEQTQRTMTLILKFDTNNVVKEFSSRSSEF